MKNEKAALKLNIQNTKIMASGTITSWQTEGGKVETVTDFIFLGSKSTADSDYSHEIKRHLLLGRKAMTNLDSTLKSRDVTLLTKVGIVKAMDFPVVQVWELDHKEAWASKNWCFQTVVLEKTLEGPFDCKIRPVNPKGNQPWIFIGRTDAEVPVLWPPDAESTHKTLMLGKTEGKRRRQEDEMVRYLHQFNAHEFEKTLRDNRGQGSLACCSLWGCQKLDLT